MRDFLQPLFDRDACSNEYKYGLPFTSYRDKLHGVNSSLLKRNTSSEMLSDLEPDEDELGADDKLPAEKHAFAQGEAVHASVLEPHLFDPGGDIEQYFQLVASKTLTTQEARQAHHACPERPVVTEAIIEKAKRARDQLMKHDRVRWIMDKADKKEASGQVWSSTTEDLPGFDNSVGYVRKWRVDWLPTYREANWMADLKTISDGDKIHSAVRLGYHCRTYGYNAQAAYYLDSHELLTGKRLDRMFFVFIAGPFGPADKPKEKGKPYMARIFEMPNLTLPGSAVQDGREVYQERASILLQAAHDDQWTAYEHEEEPQTLT